MKTIRYIQYILMIVLVVGVSLSLLSNQANAYTCPGLDTATICDNPLATCDSDQDGYTDTEECVGITLNGVSYLMDPTQKDLFLIVVDANDTDNDDCNGQDSLFPDDILYPSTDPPASLRLGLNVHVISNSMAGPGQSITASQNAVKMTENCSTADPDVAGEAIPGIPSRSPLSGSVFTYVIKNKIESACQPGFTCTDENGSLTSAEEMTLKHIINTFNHELGHMMGLSVNIDRKVGNHWPVGTGNELDQFVDCSSNTRKGTAECEISDIHGVPDIAGVRLK